MQQAISQISASDQGTLTELEGTVRFTSSFEIACFVKKVNNTLNFKRS
jgi:hypothetical protein